MSNNSNTSVEHKKRRRRNRGVPTTLVIALLVITLFFGGLIGFVVSNRTNGYRGELELAKARITELENTLTMIGFSEGDSADSWNFNAKDDSAAAIGDLSGSEAADESSAFWSSSTLTDGLLSEEQESVVVAEFDGGTLTSAEIVDAYNDALTMQAFGLSEAADTTEVLQAVLKEQVADKIVRNHAEQMGLTTLTDGDKAVIRRNAEEIYDEQCTFYTTALDLGNKNDAETKTAIEAYMRDEVGITLEGLIAQEEEDYWMQKLYDSLCAGVTVTDEELQSAYDELLAAQQTLFAQSADNFEYAIMSGETIAYNLENYRRVKHILLTFSDTETASAAIDLRDAIAQLDPANDQDKIAQLQSQLDALYVDLDAQAETLIAQLQGGADFDTLMAQYGQDEGMEYEPSKTYGYYVSSNSLQWADEFIDAAMNLANVGDLSAPVHSISGVHIIKYIADVTPGAVPMDEIRDALSAAVLDSKKQDIYEQQVAAWLTEANVKYYPDRLQ